MSGETALPENAPVMKAWAAYKASDAYQNSRRWALDENHVDGSMWAAFYAGFAAAGRAEPEPTYDPKKETGPLGWYWY